MSHHHMIKVKIKGFAEQQRFLKAERNKNSNLAARACFEQHIAHCSKNIRALHLAYAYLRGMPFWMIEPEPASKPPLDAAAHFLKHLTIPDGFETFNGMKYQRAILTHHFQRWCGEAIKHYKKSLETKDKRAERRAFFADQAKLAEYASDDPEGEWAYQMGEVTKETAEDWADTLEEAYGLDKEVGQNTG